MVPVRNAVLCSLLLVALAGCVDEPAPSAGPEVSQGFRYEDDRITIESINETADDWTPTLQEPPQWTVGEYWTVRLVDAFEGETFEVDVVVAGQEEDFWLLGMPTHDFSNDLMVLHLPGLGQVKKDTIGFEAHDVWFDPIRFPVTEGDTWTTYMMADSIELTATVTRVEGLEADVEILGPPGALGGRLQIRLTYDAEMRQIAKLDYAGYASYEVIEHGFDWHMAAPELDGVVTVPHMADLILCHGRAATVVRMNPSPCGTLAAPDGVSDKADIDSDYDRVSASLILSADLFAGDMLPVGTYTSIEALAPDGAAYTETLTALDMVATKLSAFKHDAPGGTWEITAVAPGPALAFVEGIGYHVYDVEIPSGRILPSIGEHQHGSADGH